MRFLRMKNLLLGVIKKEIQIIADKYGDDRRTSIERDVFDITTEDLIPDENCRHHDDTSWIYQAHDAG